MQDGEGGFFLKEQGSFTVVIFPGPFDYLMAVNEHFAPSMNCLVETGAANDLPVCLKEKVFS